MLPIQAGSVSCQGLGEVADPSIDVIPDQAHAVDAVDPPFGGFVGVPVVDGCAVHRCDLRFASEDDDPVGGGDDVLGDLLGGLVGDVDPDLEQDLGGRPVDRRTGSGPRRRR